MNDQISNEEAARLGERWRKQASEKTEDIVDAASATCIAPGCQSSEASADLPAQQLLAVFTNDQGEINAAMLRR